MMATQNLLCHSLLKWLETFPNQHDLTPVALSDGVVIASVLNQIEPDCFHAAWLSKIKGDVGTNWRLKVSNLRKIQHAMVEFQEHLGHNIKHFLLPDLSKIGEHNDLQELGRLLQLVLGCAINCSRKQEYIEAIMGMEESVQAVIMAAIQELYSRTEGSSGLDLTGEVLSELGPASFHPHLRTVLEQLESALQGKEEFTQRCHALEHQVSVLNEENSNLKQQRESLFEKFEALQVDTEMGGSTLRNKDLKKQVENLQDELFKAESTREEYKVRADELEKENQDFQAKNEELQTLAEQARSLKDEVDALRDMSEKVVVYEGTVETYKKKLEELSDLKRQIKLLEQKNSDYMQQNMELEEEVKKSGTWRPQLEMYKRQVADLHQKLAEETKHTDRQAFDNKKLTERLEALHQEKERLMSERESLKEMIEELKCNLTLSTDASSRLPSDLSDLDLLEVVPPEIREKLMRLQYENKVLKQQTSESSSSQVPVLEAMVNDLQERHLSVTQENRQLNHRIMELESEVEEARSGLASASGTNVSQLSSKSQLDGRRMTELEQKIVEQNDKIASLNESLMKKEGEMAAMEERYKKYLNKAKSVIKTLDPKHNPSLVPDVSTLRQQILEKDKMIDKLESESAKAKMIRDMEEKLISTAFHNYTMQMHRQMMTQRLSCTEQGHSYLSRQRQAAPRKGPISQMGNRSLTSANQFDHLRFS